MVKTNKFSRQADIVKPESLSFPIIIIGVGGIGSWATLALTKMGCSNVSVVDFDKVEIENIPSQFYKESQIGTYKVEALAENILEFTGTNIIRCNKRWHHFLTIESNYQKSIIISALDSLSARKKLFAFFKKNGFPMAYIDARMGGELLRIFTLSPQDENSIEKYRKKLYTKTKPHKERCTEKAIVYNTFLCGSLLANFVKKMAKSESVPLSTTFDIVTLNIF